MAEEKRPATPASDFQIERLSILNPITLQGKAIPQRKWFWEEWIPCGNTSALYGDGGAGKSMLALQLMVAAAAGQPFLGMPVMRCKVFGVFCEDSNDELHMRLAAILAEMRLDFADLDGMQLVSRVGEDNLLNTFTADGRSVKSPFAEQVDRAAAEFGAQFVVVDTAADTFGGNENIRGQVRQYISQLTRTAMRLDGAVLLLAHPSVTGRNSGSGDGGSTAWSNSVRSRLYIKRQDAVNGEVPDTNVRILSRLKANYAAANAEMTLRYKDGAFEVDGLASGDSADAHDRAQAADQAFLAGLIELEEQGFRVNVHRGQANYAPKSLREKTDTCSGYSEAELGAAMNRLIRHKRITSVEEGPKSRKRSRLVVVVRPLPLPAE